MLSLTKEMGSNSLDGMKKLEIGVSWDTTAGAKKGLMGKIGKKKGTDLDLIAILMQGNEPVRYAGLDSLDPLKDGSVLHSGDNTTGHGDGDDELVTCDLVKIHRNVTAIVFCAVAFKTGSSFEKAANLSFKVYDSSDGKQTEVADIWPSLLGTGNAVAVAKAFRPTALSPWEMVVVEEMGSVQQGDFKALLRFGIGK